MMSVVLYVGLFWRVHLKFHKAFMNISREYSMHIPVYAHKTTGFYITIVAG